MGKKRKEESPMGKICRGQSASLAWYLSAFFLIATLFFNCGVAQARDYGKQGEPIHLVVSAVQPWGALFPFLIIQETVSWKKNFPKGTTIEFLGDLQGT